jgi:hypothetical protein
MGTQQQEQQFTRRQFMEYLLIMEGSTWWEAKEAVASTAMEHPEWDMNERMTWPEWERRGK